MASPYVFASPLTETPLRKSHYFLSSSPDLPSVNDLVSQSLKPPPFKPSLQTPAKALESTATTKTRKDSIVTRPKVGLEVPQEEKANFIHIEDSSIIEVAADAVQDVFQSEEKERVPGATLGVAHDARSTKDRQPWKKFQFKDDIDEAAGTANIVENAASPASKIPCQPAKEQSNDMNESLNLESAMTRRLDWTPPTQKNVIALDSESPFSGASCPSQTSSSKAQSFERLVESYKCTGTLRLDAPINLDEESGFLKKRKLVEMVVDTTPKVKSNKSPEKQKAPKKKPRTITELATAAYRAETPDDSDATRGSRDMLNHASGKENESSGKDKKGKHAAAKPRKRQLKKKAPSSPEPVLLPPSEALKEVANQDFVFGTSSQLAVEKSPTFLRYLQVAMKESNELDVIDVEASPSRRYGEAPNQRPKLWHAGARDEDGELFDLEVSEIAFAPSENMHASQDGNNPFGYIQEGKNAHVVEPGSDEVKVMELDDPFDTTAEEFSSFSVPPISGTGQEGKTSKNRSLDCEPGLKPPPSSRPGELPSTSIETSKQTEDAPTDEIVSKQLPKKPIYDLYTDAQLSKEVTSYGFKAVKSRKAKIALLEQCWQSKVGSNSLGVGSSASFATKAGPSSGNQGPSKPEAKRGRGRPKKNSASTSAPQPQEPPPSAQPRESPGRARAKLEGTSTSAPVASSKAKGGRTTKKAGVKSSTTEAQPIRRIPIEIPDSESDEGIDEAKTSRESTSSPPPSVDLSLTMDDEASSLVLDDLGGSHSSGVFPYIIKAITSAPRSTDPANPSWHEKILLYDSIILEDLVAWLNDGQLKRVGCDDEVDVKEAKQWCESKSICCLRKVNLRGKERKRY